MSTNDIRFIGPSEPATVHLLDFTNQDLIATVTRGYAGIFLPSVSEEECKVFWEELGATKLKAPLEFGSATFLLENVTRAFTHQIVRYRLGTAFVQESLRFSFQGEGGNQPVVRVPANIWNNSQASEEFMSAAEEAFNVYRVLVVDSPGVNVEDARGILPTNTCTRLYFHVSYAALVHIYTQRMCCQAQSEEWTPVMQQMKTLIGEVAPKVAELMVGPWEDPRNASCGFGASFDRPCKNQEAFNANARRIANNVMPVQLS